MPGFVHSFLMLALLDLFLLIALLFSAVGGAGLLYLVLLVMFIGVPMLALHAAANSFQWAKGLNSTESTLDALTRTCCAGSLVWLVFGALHWTSQKLVDPPFAVQLLLLYVLILVVRLWAAATLNLGLWLLVPFTRRRVEAAVAAAASWAGLQLIQPAPEWCAPLLARIHPCTDAQGVLVAATFFLLSFGYMQLWGATALWAVQRFFRRRV